MNANYQHLGFETESNKIHSFWVNAPQFGFHWHYHPELEITCVKNGRGTRLVGDNVNPFEEGDFVFMGSNLPHTWVSDDDFNQSSEKMEVAVLQFHPSVFNPDLLQMPEMRNIRRLLNFAGRGIQLGEEKKERATSLLYQLIDAKGFERFSLFMSLLNFLGEEEEFTLLASNAYIPPLNNATEERILNVCRYVHNEFTNPIKLETIARIANMNPTSFCRFFRKSTGQSFSSYVNDLRIAKACNLLLDKRKLNISEIAYQSGFNSQTLFNRIFFKKKSMTPSTFRKKITHSQTKATFS